MCIGMSIPIAISLHAVPRTPETAVTTATNVDLSTVSKKEVDDSPAPRPARDGDVYVRRRPSHSHSARASKVIEIRDGSHQSIRVPVRSGQVLQVSSMRGSRVEQRSSPIPLPPAVERSSYILLNDGYADNHLHPSRSPPVVRTLITSTPCS